MAAPCPCQSSLPRAACCGRYLDGIDEPPTALACMRSRYSAYCENDVSYLLRTWHPATRPDELRLDGDVRWLGLKIHGVQAGGENDATGSVEFTARWRAAGRGSRFRPSRR